TLQSLRETLVGELSQPIEAEKLRKGAALPPARVLDFLGKFQADLLLVGISISEQGEKGGESLFLYSAEQPEPDIVKLDLAKPAEVQDFLTRFDQVREFIRPWVGAAFTDTLLGEGPVLVRVVKTGPADRSGLLAADQVLLVNGKKVAEARSLQVGTAGWKEKERLSFTVQRDTTSQNIALTVESTPVLIPLFSPDRLYNKALCDYRPLARGGDEAYLRALAQLNLGLAFMHFQAYDKALSESFNVVNLPAGVGISRGTVRYYQGLCYLKKDLVREARTAFQEAAASPDATLESNDGPPVAARAENLLR